MKKDAFVLNHSLFADGGALSLNQGENILTSHDFFQLSRIAKSKKISLCNETVDDSTNAFDVSRDILKDQLIVFLKIN